MTTKLTASSNRVNGSRTSASKNSEVVAQLREDNERMREALEGVLTILGNPEGYCEDDRTEVVHAKAEAERGLGQRR